MIESNYYDSLSTMSPPGNHQRYLALPMTEEEYWESGRYDADYLLYRWGELFLHDQNDHDVTIAEFGPGDGRVTMAVADNLLHIDVIDKSLPSLMDFVRTVWESHYETGNHIRIAFHPQSHVYDFVYALQVFQHCTEQQEDMLFGQMLDALKFAGVGCIHFPMAGSKPDFVPNTTCRVYTLKDIQERIKRWRNFSWYHVLPLDERYMFAPRPIPAAGMEVCNFDYCLWFQKGA